jgi:hypothetical protein
LKGEIEKKKTFKKDKKNKRISIKLKKIKHHKFGLRDEIENQ